MTSPGSLQLPEATIRSVFRGEEQLMGSTAAAQDLLLRSPNLWSTGVERLATNLRALQQLYGCSVQQAKTVLMRAPQLAYLKLEAPKFQCRVAVLTEWYGHASPGGCAGQTAMILVPGACLSLHAQQELLVPEPFSPSTVFLPCAAVMLPAPNHGTQLKSSLWKLGARMAFIRRLRLERAEPELNTSMLANTTERFCRAIRVRKEECVEFEQRWLASPEAAELCRHEGPPHVMVVRAADADFWAARIVKLPFHPGR
jgi:hypothetical protein